MLIKDLIYSIIRRWRILLVVTLVMGICGAAFYAVGNLSARRSEGNDVNQATEASEKWQSAEDYYIASLNYTVIGSDEHLAQAARDAYILHLNGSTFKRQLSEQFFPDYDSINYVSSVFFSGVGATATGLSVQLLHYDEELCQQFIQYMEQYLKAFSESVTTDVGTHRAVLVDTGVAEGFDASFEQWLEKVQAALSADEKEVDAFVGFSKKKFVIYGVLAAAVADFLLVVFFLLSDTMKDRIYSPRQLSEEGAETLLGDLSFANTKGKIDGLLYRWFIKRNYFSLEGEVKLISRRLPSGERYVFTGIVPEDKLGEVKELFAKETAQSAAFDVRPLLSENAAELSDWNTDEKMIFVVKRFQDSGRSVRRWMEIYRGINVPVAGILFI